MTLQAAEVDPHEILFTRIDDRGRRDWLIDRLRYDLEVLALRPTLVDVDALDVARIQRDRGIDTTRVRAILSSGLPIYEPILFLTDDDGRHILMDGHHRFVAAHIAKYREILAKVIPHWLGEKYRVEGIDLPTDKAALFKMWLTTGRNR